MGYVQAYVANRITRVDLDDDTEPGQRRLLAEADPKNKRCIKIMRVLILHWRALGAKRKDSY